MEFVGLIIVIIFFFFIASKVYDHEKEHIDPLIKKIKGWFPSDEEGDDELGPDEDFAVGYKGYAHY